MKTGRFGGKDKYGLDGDKGEPKHWFSRKDIENLSEKVAALSLEVIPLVNDAGKEKGLEKDQLRAYRANTFAEYLRSIYPFRNTIETSFKLPDWASRVMHRIGLHQEQKLYL